MVLRRKKKPPKPRSRPQKIAGDPKLGRQIRAARQLLAWARIDLAYRCNVSSMTLAGIEAGTLAVVPGTLTKVIKALEEAGIEFIAKRGRNGEGYGAMVWHHREDES